MTFSLGLMEVWQQCHLNLGLGVFLLCCSLVLSKYSNILKLVVESKTSVACDSLPILVYSNGRSGPRLK